MRRSAVGRARTARSRPRARTRAKGNSSLLARRIPGIGEWVMCVKRSEWGPLCSHLPADTFPADYGSPQAHIPHRPHPAHPYSARPPISRPPTRLFVHQPSSDLWRGQRSSRGHSGTSSSGMPWCAHGVRRATLPRVVPTVIVQDEDSTHCSSGGGDRATAAQWNAGTRLKCQVVVGSVDN